MTRRQYSLHQITNLRGEREFLSPSFNNIKVMKTILQLSSAIFTILLGHLLVYIDFFCKGIVHENTLLYFGQCLIYAGSALSVKLYIQYLQAKYGKNN